MGCLNLGMISFHYLNKDEQKFWFLSQELRINMKRIQPYINICKSTGRVWEYWICCWPFIWKDILNFAFTSVFLRRTLEMHVQTGHHIYQSEPTHQKDLRCPFCLYQTKNKNNMIDHIVLHRGASNTQQDSVLHLLSLSVVLPWLL